MAFPDPPQSFQDAVDAYTQSTKDMPMDLAVRAYDEDYDHPIDIEAEYSVTPDELREELDRRGLEIREEDFE